MVVAEITCPPAPDVFSATRQGSGSTYLAVVTYTCDSGLRMEDGHGSKAITCLEHERWSSEEFSCGGTYPVYRHDTTVQL